ncbi:MAG: ABC transporter permease [Pseudomonadota bacterium]
MKATKLAGNGDWLEAWQSLRRRPVRSFLSSLGVAIGVVALVAMMSIGEGAKQEALRKIVSLGVDTVRVERQSLNKTTQSDSFINLSKGLVVSDAASLSEGLGSRGLVAYYVKDNTKRVSTQQRRAAADVIAVSETWYKVEKLGVQNGRWISELEFKRQDRVCVLGAGLRQRLQAAISSYITVGNQTCKMVGVLEDRQPLLTDGTGLSSLEFNDLLILPHGTFSPQPPLNHESIHGLSILLDTQEMEEINQLANWVDTRLRQRHQDVEDYLLVVPSALMSTVRATQHMFQLVMGSIASLSLLVGGIGISNIMLANVAEQTREIGLRMSIGCSQNRVVSLYLWHSILLCLTGALLGLLGGILFALVVQTKAEWPVQFSLLALAVGPAFALITGVLFGIHPAIQAAKLEPFAALRES